MRKVLFVILVSVLLLSLYLVSSEGIMVEASADIYQGDLILDDNNVTIIEGYFTINGSIHIRENATLILRNAVVNFTKSGSGLRMLYPANGNPRLHVENTEFAGDTDNRFFGNSSATFSNTTGNVYFYFYDETNGNFSNSAIDGFNARESSTVTVFNSTIQYLSLTLYDCDISAVNLSPGFFNHWNFQENCSVVFKPQTEAPDVVFSQTTVNNWDLSLHGNSTATMTGCELLGLAMNANTTVHPNARVDVYDSKIDYVELYTSAALKLTNTTRTDTRLYDGSIISICWYLDVHVVDDSPTPGQSVQSANVTASFSNGTLAEQSLTGVDGWTRLTLMEKMANATGDYPVGTYTINATYQSYSSSSAVNMNESKTMTLTLEGFVVPEFPSFLMLSIFAMATLLAVITHKRKRHHTRTSYPSI
jgi:hypothetical protein